MVARLLSQRRVFSSLLQNQSNNPLVPKIKDSSTWNFIPSLFGLQGRTNHTLVESTTITTEDVKKEDVKDKENLLELVKEKKNESQIKFSAKSSLKTSDRHDTAMVFTCKVCETRSVKTICRESYEKGVVVARCGGCDNLHLIADRLGWFGEPGSIEEYLEVKKGSIDTLNLTLDDLAGLKNAQ
ncbi:Dnl-type zinc finger protein [Thalictrum thalictroides]|uniref:Dnl-type zinc finger protein n=1 Tax=Thalictrum thalictroides TaxID=46969 RepID=A0A7J6X6J8_THATH|nr:Dnl-type zinc finger protein [Thalictrum thalictroides]